MIRLFSFLMVLLLIGFISSYSVFAQTVGEHKSTSNGTETDVSAETAQTDCKNISENDVKSDTSTNQGQKSGSGTGSDLAK